MPKYVIERQVPGAGNLSSDELKAISQTSCGVLRKLGPEIQWAHADNSLFYDGLARLTRDIYIAANEELVREHASQGGFPANSVAEVKSIIDPTTAED